MKIPAWNPTQPVILLVDNDKESNSLFQVYNQSSEEEMQTSKDDKDFYHYYSNLYLVKMPHVGEKKETYIEDLFDQDWLNGITYNGKKFLEVIRI